MSVPSKLLRFAGAALLAICLSAAAPPLAKSTVPANARMADFIRAVLPYAASDFAALRGASISDLSDDAYGGYKLRVKAGLCSDCRIYDWYGRGTTAESWSVSDLYEEDPTGSDELIDTSTPSTPEPIGSASPGAETPTGSPPPGAEIPPPGARKSPPPEWPIEKTEAYVKSQLAPVLTGFSLRRTTTYGMAGVYAPTLIWSGPQHVWVKAKMYPQAIIGIIKVAVYVGHDLTKSTHILSHPTKAQLTQMQSAVRRMIQAAVPAASGDFAPLRGAVVDDGVPHYSVAASFGSSFRPCEIFDVAALKSKTWDRDSDPASTMDCNTYSMLGARKSLEEIVRSAISAALPPGFASSAADAKSRGYDYLWKNDEGVSVAVDWGDPQSDVVRFMIRVMHFLPKQ